MNILYNCDNNYLPYAGTSITSLFENNKELDEINVYIIGFEISDMNIVKLNRLAEQYGRSITLVDAKDIDNFFVRNGARIWRGSLATFYRLFIDQVIPENVDRVLYIDADTVVVDSLKDLEAFEFEDHKACAMTYDRVFDGYNEYIHLPTDKPYYNAGVILFDLKKWRAFDCSKKIMKAIEKGYASFAVADQDLLSHAVNDNIQLLNPRYNVFSCWIDLGVKNINAYLEVNNDNTNYYLPRELESALANPAILHCRSIHTHAPWVKHSRNPFRGEWVKYNEVSPWKNVESVKAKLKLNKKVSRALFYTLPKPLYCRIIKTYNIYQVKKYYSNLGRIDNAMK